MVLSFKADASSANSSLAPSASGELGRFCRNSSKKPVSPLPGDWSTQGQHLATACPHPHPWCWGIRGPTVSKVRQPRQRHVCGSRGYLLPEKSLRSPMELSAHLGCLIVVVVCRLEAECGGTVGAVIVPRSPEIRVRFLVGSGPFDQRCIQEPVAKFQRPVVLLRLVVKSANVTAPFDGRVALSTTSGVVDLPVFAISTRRSMPVEILP